MWGILVLDPGDLVRDLGSPALPRKETVIIVRPPSYELGFLYPFFSQQPESHSVTCPSGG